MAFEVGAIVARLKLDTKSFQSSIDGVKKRLGKVAGQKIALTIDQSRLGKQLTRVRERLRSLNKSARVRLSVDRKSFTKSLSASKKDIREFASKIKEVVGAAITRLKDKKIPLQLRTREWTQRLNAQFVRLNKLKRLAASVQLGGAGSNTGQLATALNTGFASVNKNLQTLIANIGKVNKQAQQTKTAFRPLLSLLKTLSKYTGLTAITKGLISATKAAYNFIWPLNLILKALGKLGKAAGLAGLRALGRSFANVGKSIVRFGTHIHQYALKPLNIFRRSIFNLKNIIIVVLAREAIQRAMQIDSVTAGFDNLSASIGTTGSKLKKDLRAALRGTVSDFDLMKTANNAMILKVAQTGDQLAELAQIARVLGRAVGRDAVDAFNDLATGIGRQSRLILDNLGIVVNVGKAWDDYANSLGKSAEELSDWQRRAAFQEAVIQQGREMMLVLGDDADTLADQYGRMFADIQNALDNIIKGIVIPDIAIDVSNMIRNNAGRIKAAGRLLGNVLRITWRAVGDTFKNFVQADGTKRIQDITMIFIAVMSAALTGMFKQLLILTEFLITGPLWKVLALAFGVVGARLNKLLIKKASSIAKNLGGLFGFLFDTTGLDEKVAEATNKLLELTDIDDEDLEEKLEEASEGLNEAVKKFSEDTKTNLQEKINQILKDLDGTFAGPIAKIPEKLAEAFRTFDFEKALPEEQISLNLSKSDPALESVRSYGQTILTLRNQMVDGTATAEEFFKVLEEGAQFTAQDFPMMDPERAGKFNKAMEEAVANFNELNKAAGKEFARGLLKNLTLNPDAIGKSSQMVTLVTALAAAYEDLAEEAGQARKDLKIDYNPEALSQFQDLMREFAELSEIDLQVVGADPAISAIAEFIARAKKQFEKIGVGISKDDADRERDRYLRTIEGQAAVQQAEISADLSRRRSLIGGDALLGGVQEAEALLAQQSQVATETAGMKAMGFSDEAIADRMTEIQNQWGETVKDIRRTTGIELIAGMGRDLLQTFGNSLVDAFARGEKASKAFSSFMAQTFTKYMSDAIADISAGLERGLASALESLTGAEEGSLLAGIGKMAKGLIGIGAAIYTMTQRAGGEHQVDDFGDDLVDESEAVRGVIAGPTNVAISKVGSQLKVALQTTEMLLLRIAVAVEGGGGSAGGTLNQDPLGATPGMAYRLSPSTQY